MSSKHLNTERHQFNIDDRRIKPYLDKESVTNIVKKNSTQWKKTSLFPTEVCKENKCNFKYSLRIEPAQRQFIKNCKGDIWCNTINYKINILRFVHLSVQNRALFLSRLVNIICLVEKIRKRPKVSSTTKKEFKWMRI